MKQFLAAVALATLAWSSAQAGDISGAGATFPYPIYAKWADAYKQKTGVGLNYQSIGSGGGIKPGELTLDGPTLAAIFMGEITSWDDAKIKALNPNVKLPSMAVAVVHRSDGSGTSFLFTDYLSKTSPEWKDKVGANSSVEWPVGLGAKGNEGVAGQTTQTDGAIGYVEYAYAKQNKMTYTKMVNSEGKVVEPKTAAFQAAAASVDWAKSPGYYVILTNQPGADSWPITGASFILIYKQPDDPEAVKTALQFFDWAYKDGDKMAEDLDYVPIPDKLVDLVKTTWKSSVTDGSGKAIY